MGITLIGMDEAGYGPNLGPLVVAATAWEIDDVTERSGASVQGEGNAGTGSNHEPVGARPVATTSTFPPRLGDIDLYHRLRSAVAPAADDRRVPIADSKVLYRPGCGLRQLERGVHGVLGAMKRQATCWSELVATCRADPRGLRHDLCWHDRFDCVLPVDATAEELGELSARFAAACGEHGVRPMAVVARLVFPAEFNGLVEQHGTKGGALSHVTVGLLRELLTELADDEPAPVLAVCDKHGGRNFYGGLLQHHFSEHWIEPVVEGASESRYTWGPRDRRVQVSFRTKGESFLPTALASMLAKYLRELAMRAFNEFWCRQTPGLKPTAGYPVDARRFKAAIEAKQRELRIDDHVLWRSR